jgi:hypothetical protein
MIFIVWLLGCEHAGIALTDDLHIRDSNAEIRHNEAWLECKNDVEGMSGLKS